jgi:hypothetical protein
MSISRMLKHEFIRRMITKEEYEILKENRSDDVPKDFLSKKTDDITTDKE